MHSTLQSISAVGLCALLAATSTHVAPASADTKHNVVEGRMYTNGTQVYWSVTNPTAPPVITHWSAEQLKQHLTKRDIMKRGDSACWSQGLNPADTDNAVSHLYGSVPRELVTNDKDFNPYYAVLVNDVQVYVCLNRKQANWGEKYSWSVTKDSISQGLISMDSVCRGYQAGYAWNISPGAPDQLQYHLVGKAPVSVPVCVGA
jgi:hypothetical protein